MPEQNQHNNLPDDTYKQGDPRVIPEPPKVPEIYPIVQSEPREIPPPPNEDRISQNSDD
jgi:hypothetical protein